MPEESVPPASISLSNVSKTFIISGFFACLRRTSIARYSDSPAVSIPERFLAKRIFSCNFIPPNIPSSEILNAATAPFSFIVSGISP